MQLPPGVLNLVIGQGNRIGDALLEHPVLDAVSFTGSTATGLGIAERCARRNMKYQTEMGGKNAAIVLKDADVAQAVAMIVSGAFRSAGQKCTATSRVIVEQSVYETFTEALRQAVEKFRSLRRSTLVRILDLWHPRASTRRLCPMYRWPAGKRTF